MKGQILQVLRRSEEYVSGECLARQLGISRVAVWKHVQRLKQDGYKIEIAPGGYRLVQSPDLLLPCEFPELEQRIRHFLELGSTMDVARELAKKGAPAGTIIIAETQTKGRGRLGREWLSPRGGIYFTLILRPCISPAYAPRINLMAAVAVALTMRELFLLHAEVKWPNDVLIGGKKVCGILAEMDAELDRINYVNLGIGINANVPPQQLVETATSLQAELGREISRRDFLRALLTELEAWQERLMDSMLLQEWKRLSATLQRQVKIVAADQVVEGDAIDIDAYGALLVRNRSGEINRILAGDCVHLRERGGDKT